jgi:hypothetical protein
MKAAAGGMLVRAAVIAGLCLAASVTQPDGVAGQLSSVSGPLQHARGQNVAPIYEGWYRSPDGAVNVSFGYLNKNYEEALDVPLGPSNRIEPGPVDQGQPTHFLPRRHYGVFVVTLPKDQPKTEIAWTLSMRGRTESVPANLSDLYMIDALSHVGGTDEGSTPPVLTFGSAATESAVGPGGLTTARDATVGQPLPLSVWVSDQRPDASAISSAAEPGGANARPRFTVTWHPYRRVGPVQFSDARPAIEQGTATTAVTFDESGEYVLRVVALRGSRFGGQCCWTNGYVRVKVGRADAPR